MQGEGRLKGITGVGHVAIKVSDLDRSLDFYVKKLGFPEMMRLRKDDGSTWLVYLRFQKMRGTLTESAYAAEIELARSTVLAHPATHWQEFLAAWA